MKLISKALALAVALVGVHTASAGTTDFTIQGNSCVSTTPGNAPVYTQYGPYNSSTTSPMMLTCPIPFGNHPYYQGFIQVIGYTRNTGDQVFCNLVATDGYGNGQNYVQAKVAYNGGSPNLGSAYLYSNANSNFLYVTCHIPVATANGKSYLSSLYVAGYY